MPVLKTKAGGSVYQVGGPGTPQPLPGAAVDLPNTFTADQTFTGKLLPAGTGTNSTRLGNTSAANVSGLEAIGAGLTAIASGDRSVGIGRSCQATAGDSVAVGPYAEATGGSQVIAIGRTAKAIGPNSLAIGGAAWATAPESVVIGRQANAVAGFGSMAIGFESVANGMRLADGTIVTGPNPNGETLAVGWMSQAFDWRATAVGSRAEANNVSSTAIGRGAIANGVHDVAIGRGSWTPGMGVNGVVALGFAGGALDVYFNSGHTHRSINQIDGNEDNNLPTARPITVHGCDAFDSRGRIVTDGATFGTAVVQSVAAKFQVADIDRLIYGGSIPPGATILSMVAASHVGNGLYTQVNISAPATTTASGVSITVADVAAWTPTTDIAGGDLLLVAGRGTGTAAGGSLKLQAAPAGGVSNNVKNALVTRVEANATGLGFFGTTPIAKPTGVAVDAAGIHAALVSLGLIAA